MATTNNTTETLLNEHDVARITGLSVASVRRWRLLRQGPKYIKIGAAVRYKPGDIPGWLETPPARGGWGEGGQEAGSAHPLPRGGGPPHFPARRPPPDATGPPGGGGAL